MQADPNSTFSPSAAGSARKSAVTRLEHPEGGDDDDSELDQVVLDELPPLEPDDADPVTAEIRIDVPLFDGFHEEEEPVQDESVPLELPRDVDEAPDSPREISPSDVELITPLLDEPADDEPSHPESPELVRLPDFLDVDETETFSDPSPWDFGAELPRRPGFTLEWHDREAASQLLALAGGIVVMAKECRHHTLDGRVVARRPLPQGFRRAEVARRTTWMRVGSAAEPVDGFDLLCVAGDHLYVRSDDRWKLLGDDDASFDIEARDLLRRDDHVLLGARDGRWYSLEEGALRPAFGGRRLLSLCSAASWIGIEDRGLGAMLLALEGEAARPLSDCPSGPRLRSAARGHTVVVDAMGEGLWLSNQSGAGLEKISGSQRFRGVCLGERHGEPKVWTTLEEGDGLELVEIDVASGRQSSAFTLPWRSNDDDSPTVHDMLWLDQERLLLVASDFGVACLRASEPRPDASES